MYVPLPYALEDVLGNRFAALPPDTFLQLPEGAVTPSEDRGSQGRGRGTKSTEGDVAGRHKSKGLLSGFSLTEPRRVWVSGRSD